MKEISQQLIEKIYLDVYIMLQLERKNWVGEAGIQIRAFDAENSDEFIKELSAEELKIIVEGSVGKPVAFLDRNDEDSLDINGNVVYKEGRTSGG